MMTLRFIYFKSSEPQDVEEQLFRFASLFFNSAEYLIRCWTFDVRCSMFIFPAFSAKNNLALMGFIPARKGLNVD